MNEIQRILEKGIIKPEFLVPETICDFYVDEKRKKLWAVLLDLLHEFDKVCQRHHLRYFISAGTLLGAIRHHGFIPWDDDIDVEMPREDYDKLIQYKDEFSLPYKYQTPETDPGYFLSFNKLRNANTSSVSVILQYAGFCQGAFLDIFPMDSFKAETMHAKHKRIMELVLDLGTYLRIGNPELDEKNLQRVASYSGRDPKDTYRMLQDLFLEDKDKDCEYIGLLSCPLYDIERMKRYKEDYAETVLVDFCGMKCPAPKGYDRVLHMQYGDYWQLPPVEGRGAWHSGIIFDMDKPYTYYLKHK
jgi:lipopolysaccharide cholinephosphotransferase